MSWSVSFIGNPEKVAEALRAESEKLSGQSKVEYDAVAGSLAALVLENFNRGEGQQDPIVRLEAAGHGHAAGDAQVSRCVSVKLETFYAQLLL